VKTLCLLDEIREANLTYLVLAQKMIRADKADALYRLGVGEDVADIIVNFTTGQLLKIASSNMLICQFRFDQQIVWNLLLGHTKDLEAEGVNGIHAAILMASRAAAAS
jgi:flagellar transcriptional activator FlhD